MAHAYFVLREAGQPDRILVWDTRTLSIGRGPGNDLLVSDDEISRKHALLEKKDDRFAVGDYRTGNGTFMNGERVQHSAEFHAGDVIRVGKLELEFVIAAANPATGGVKVEYASHLKTVGKLPKGVDGDRTMLSLTDTAGGDDEFVVEPERASGGNAFRAGARDELDFQVRDLDESLDQMDLPLASDELELSDSFEPVAEPPARTPAAPRAAAPRAPTAPRAPAGEATRPRGPAAASASTPASKASASASADGGDPTSRLRKLKVLLDEGLISEDEFRAKRARILDEM